MVHRYFYDCEFIEDGRLIDLVSIGVVDEGGREFYAVSTEFDATRALPWVRRNVLDKLPSPAATAWRSRERIRDDLHHFLVEPMRSGEADTIELWAWYAAYDHVVLAQLWGAMPALPREIPRFTKDLRQRWDDVGCPRLPSPGADRHDALADARHNLARWRAMGEASWEYRSGGAVERSADECRG
ncbi:MAG: polyadenylate-specific 3'-exoribonuclease AS [Micromonosporaceae bacterium]|nr:polyadenylate-specific 3'-exoribonuclease AS [Micromonosporaceae bacterium]